MTEKKVTLDVIILITTIGREVGGQRPAQSGFPTAPSQTRRAHFRRNGLSTSTQPCLCGPQNDMHMMDQRHI
jgi:hypothetical protein